MIRDVRIEPFYFDKELAKVVPMWHLRPAFFMPEENLKESDYETVSVSSSAHFFESLKVCNDILDAQIELKQAELKHYIETKNTNYSFTSLEKKLNKLIKKSERATDNLNTYKDKSASEKLDNKISDKVAELLDKDISLLSCLHEGSNFNVLSGYKIANVKYDITFYPRASDHIIRTPYTDIELKQNKLNIFKNVLLSMQAGKTYNNLDKLDNLDDTEALHEFALNNDMTLLVNNAEKTQSYVRYVISSELVRIVKTIYKFEHTDTSHDYLVDRIELKHIIKLIELRHLIAPRLLGHLQ